MRLVIAIALFAATSAYAADTIPNGTFAGDKPRGSAVSASTDIYRDAGSSYGQSWAQPRTEEAHNQPGPGSEVANDIQAHIGTENNVPGSQDVAGYGRNK